MTKPKMDMSKIKCFEARSAIAVVAAPEKENLTIVFEPGPNEDVQGIAVEIHSSAIGAMVAQIKSEYAKISIKAEDDRALLLQTQLTGARPAWDQNGTPILLLQLDGVFELAVSLTKSQALIVRNVAEQLSSSLAPSPAKKH